VVNISAVMRFTVFATCVFAERGLVSHCWRYFVCKMSLVLMLVLLWWFVQSGCWKRTERSGLRCCKSTVDVTSGRFLFASPTLCPHCVAKINHPQHFRL